MSVALYMLLVKLKLLKSDYIKEGFCLKIIQLYLLKRLLKFENGDIALQRRCKTDCPLQ